MAADPHGRAKQVERNEQTIGHPPLFEYKPLRTTWPHAQTAIRRLSSIVPVSRDSDTPMLLNTLWSSSNRTMILSRSYALNATACAGPSTLAQSRYENPPQLPPISGQASQRNDSAGASQAWQESRRATSTCQKPRLLLLVGSANYSFSVGRNAAILSGNGDSAVPALHRGHLGVLALDGRWRLIVVEGEAR
jgi:hypothetical protein